MSVRQPASTPPPPIVKICGLTRSEDVAVAVELGVDFLGFVVCPSPRRIDLTTMRSLIEEAQVANPVAVMVDPSPEEVEAALAHGARWIQLHGQESPRFCRPYAPQVIKALRLSSAADLERAQEYADAASWLLLDSPRPGTGSRFDWTWLAEHRPTMPFFLSGGLNPANLAEAVTLVHPPAIDLSSGVEDAPGCKQAAKMRTIMEVLGRC